MERKPRGTKADSRSCPGTLGSDAAGPPWFGSFLGVQLPESLVGDRANAFDRQGQSFGTKITKSSGHGGEGQGNQSRQSELPWDSRFGRGGSERVGSFLGVQLPESLVGDRASAFDRQGQSFGTKITKSSGHGGQGQGNQSRQSEMPWDSRFGRGGSERVGWFLGVQLPESLVGDRANAFDRYGQSFGTKITRSSGHGEKGQGNQSRQSGMSWDSRFGRGGSPLVRVVPRRSTA